MLDRLTNLASKIFKRHFEFCLLIEQIDDYFFLTEAKLRNKEIRILKSKKNSNLSFLKKTTFRLFDKLIIALNSREISTIQKTITLKREEPKEGIGENELDELIFKAFWEFSSYCRNIAAKRMALTELDVVLSSIEILDIKLDNRSVLDLINCKCNNFSITFRGTFISRNLHAYFSKFKGIAKNIILVERDSIIASSVPEQFNYFVNISNSNATIFAFKDDELSFFDEIEWDRTNFVESLGDRFALDEETSFSLLDFFLKAEISNSVKKAIESELKRDFGSFSKLIFSILKIKSLKRPVIYFNFNFAVPEFFTENTRFKSFDFKHWLNENGFSIIDKRGALKYGTNALVFLSYNYVNPHYVHLDQLLKRRVKWLTVN